MGSMENRAQFAWQEHTRRCRDMTNAAYATQTRIQQLLGPQRHRHASLVRQAPARLTGKGAQSALAMRATRGLTEATAQRARPEGTRRRREQPNASHVPQARIQQLSGHRHASVVRHTPGRLKGAQSALAMRATRGLTEATA